MANEPKTFEDLILMLKTSNQGWFDGQIRYENLHKGGEAIEPGMLSDRRVVVTPWPDQVVVEEKTHIYDHPFDTGGWGLKVQSRTLAKFDSMEDFKNSEWWADTMEQWKDGDTDASWKNYVLVDGEKIEGKFREETSFSCEVGYVYRDWLGNYRTGKGHREFRVLVDRERGNLDFYLEDEDFHTDFDELAEMLRTYDKLKSAGITVEDDELRIPMKSE